MERGDESDRRKNQKRNEDVAQGIGGRRKQRKTKKKRERGSRRRTGGVEQERGRDVQ